MKEKKNLIKRLLVGILRALAWFFGAKMPKKHQKVPSETRTPERKRYLRAKKKLCAIELRTKEGKVVKIKGKNVKKKQINKKSIKNTSSKKKNKKSA